MHKYLSAALAALMASPAMAAAITANAGKFFYAGVLKTFHLFSN